MTRGSSLFATLFLVALIALAFSCSRSDGNPYQEEDLGLFSCESHADCGLGRFCNPVGFCDLQCREDADCSYFGSGLACDSHGQCLTDPTDIACSSHEECGEEAYCNFGIGRCAPYCRLQGDCVEILQTNEELQAYCDGENSDQCLTCSSFGVCIAEDENDTCKTHDDCGPDRYCNVNLGLCAPFCTGKGDCLSYCKKTDTCAKQCNNMPECEAISLDGDEDPPPCCDNPGDQMECTQFRQCIEKAVLDLPEDDPNYIDTSSIDTLPCPDFDSVCTSLGYGYTCNAQKICSGDPEDIDFGEVDTSYPASEYVGIWGNLITTATISTEVPIFGVQRVYSHRLEVVRITHEEDTLYMDHKVCSLQVKNFTEDGSPVESPSRILSPPNYIRALETIRHPIADIKSIDPGTRIKSERVFEPRGWKLENPTYADYDNMPDEESYKAGDSRIFDQDLDGHPGMTNIMDGVIRGEVYNVSLMVTVFDGEVVDKNHIGGLLGEFRNVIHNIDASKSILVQNVETNTHPDAKRNYFRMMRLPNSTSCADVLEYASIPGHWLSPTDFVDDVTVE